MHIPAFPSSALPRPPEGCAPLVLGTLADALAAGLASLPDLAQAVNVNGWSVRVVACARHWDLRSPTQKRGISKCAVGSTRQHGLGLKRSACVYCV